MHLHFNKLRDDNSDWRQEKGTTKDEMVGWHHQLDGHEFEQAPGVGDGQESLACCSLWGHKESDTTEWLNWTDWTQSEIKTKNFLKWHLWNISIDWCLRTYILFHTFWLLYLCEVRDYGLDQTDFFLFVVNFVIHWNETAMGLHVFPIPILPPTSHSTRSP